MSIARTYRGAHAAAGPLLYLSGAQRVALGEWVSVQSEGQPDVRGQVIDAGQDITVVQVLEETVGLPPATARITLTGDLARVVVGRDLLGRALSGVGEPKDGLPRPIGEAQRPLWSAPINPTCRVPPGDFIETGISAIDGLNTLVRGQKLPVFSSPGLPALDLAATIVELQLGKFFNRLWTFVNSVIMRIHIEYTIMTSQTCFVDNQDSD